jgi:hypothetical protein
MKQHRRQDARSLIAVVWTCQPPILAGERMPRLNSVRPGAFLIGAASVAFAAFPNRDLVNLGVALTRKPGCHLTPDALEIAEQTEV